MFRKPSKLLVSTFATAAAILSGCATAVVDESTFFVDPARYALYDCQQLATARTSYAKRVEELQGLMAKAETGAGGAIVAEVAYRSDYLSAQGNLKSVNAALERNRCATEPVAARSQSRAY